MSTAVIAGRYELGERLGFGGMSTVQLAVDRRLERQVAVKLLAEHLADDSQFISRFRREALSAARLVHPNIVQVFDFGLDEASGRHYIVMEYIHGRSGAEILREETRLGVADTLELVDGACRGLAHAHRMGVVHRDVKPGNIMRSDDGAVKLADFGIAKAMVGQTSQITQAGSVLGTAAYLAPEQARAEEVTAAADVYALGLVLVELLTGHPNRNARVNGALGPTIKRCLEKDPRLRPSAAEVERELEGDTAVAPTAILPPKRRRRTPLVLAGVAAVTVAAGIAAALASSGGSPPPPPARRPATITPLQQAPTAQQQAQDIAAWLLRYSR
jgi:eukaryotic-like serine/threonine-protein kinase